MDDKGRVSIPSRLRNTLEQNSEGRSLSVTKHPTEPCLICYDSGFLDALPEYLQNVVAEGKDADARLTPSALDRLMGMSEDLPFDGSGRFVLPGFMRSSAGIEKQALIFGTFHTIEVWNPQSALESNAVPEPVKDMARYLLAGGK